MATKKEFDIREDETYSDWKRRKHEERGLQGMGQKNVKKKDNWTEEQKRGYRNKNKGRRKQNEARKKLMIPHKKVKEIIIRHDDLEKELSSGKIDPKLFAKKSKEYSNLESIISTAKEYLNFENEININ